MINAHHIKLHVTVRGAQTLTSIHSIHSSGGNAGVYSPNDHKEAECHPDILHLLSQFGNGCGRFWRKTMFRFIMHHTCSIGERYGDLAGQDSCCTTRRARCVAVAIRGRTLSCWKSTSPSCRRNENSTGLTTCAM